MGFFARTALAAVLVGSLAGSADPQPALQEPASIEQVQGTGGWLSKAGCIACAAGFLAASGTGSIAALALVAGSAPELAMGCAIACIDGFAM